MNKVFLVGNLTKDPEMRQTKNGANVCDFRIAINRRKNKDGVQEADFLTIQTWNGLAENCQKYLHKGSKVAVDGQIRTRNYEAQDGTKRYVTEILADNVEFLTRGEAAPQNSQHETDTYTETFTETSDDGLPW